MTAKTVTVVLPESAGMRSFVDKMLDTATDDLNNVTCIVDASQNAVSSLSTWQQFIKRVLWDAQCSRMIVKKPTSWATKRIRNALEPYPEEVRARIEIQPR